MKKIESVILHAEDDKINVQKAFNDYLAKPCVESAIRVVYFCAKQIMVGTPVPKITLEFDKLGMGKACYKDGVIKISVKTLKKCKKPEHLVEILNSLFHEFSHALVDFSNNLYLTKQDNVGEYIAPYFDGYFFDLFKRITNGDLEIASACAMYFYILNKDEDIARQFSAEMTAKYIEEFCPNRGLIVKTHKQLNNQLWHNYYDFHKDMRYNPKLPMMILNSFQKEFIQKLSQGVSAKELDDFMLTLQLQNTPQMRKALIDYCISCKNFDHLQTIISNPLIKVTKEEHVLLQSIYGQQVLAKYIFGYGKFVEKEQQISK